MSKRVLFISFALFSFVFGMSALVTHQPTGQIVFGVLAMFFAGYALVLWRWPALSQPKNKSLKSSDAGDGCLGAMFLILIQPSVLITGPLFIAALYVLWPNWEAAIITWFVIVIVIAYAFS